MMQHADAIVRRVRTTVNIDDHLLMRAKELAVRSRRSLGDIIDDALRVHLSVGPSEDRGAPVELPVFGGSGLQPGVDLEDPDALAALLGDDVVDDRAAR
jgi:hypothetical protein